MIWEEITILSLFLGGLNKQIEVVFAELRFLAQSDTLDPQS